MTSGFLAAGFRIAFFGADERFWLFFEARLNDFFAGFRIDL